MGWVCAKHQIRCSKSCWRLKRATSAENVISQQSGPARNLSCTLKADTIPIIPPAQFFHRLSVLVHRHLWLLLGETPEDHCDRRRHLSSWEKNLFPSTLSITYLNMQENNWFIMTNLQRSINKNITQNRIMQLGAKPQKYKSITKGTRRIFLKAFGQN